MSFPRYQRYKDSGVDWLGEVPEHWQVLKLARTFRAIGSGTTPQSGVLEYYDNGHIPWVNTGDLNDSFITDEPQKVTDAALRDYTSLKLHPTQSVVMAMYGATIGKLGFLTFPATVNQACCVLYDSIEVHNRYLFYWLLGLRQQIVSMATGSGQPNISQNLIRTLQISCPSTSEQHLIVDFLDVETAKIDALIEEQRRLIELLKEKRQAVISHAVTKGLQLDSPMKDSGIQWIGAVPESWKITKLGRICFMQEGPGLRYWQFTDGGIRVICVTNITEDGISFASYEKFISEDEYNSTYSHFTVMPGDILLSSSGNSWGKVAIYKEDEVVILNTSTIRLSETKGGPLLQDFLALSLKADSVREQLWLAMTGSCQPNFGPSHLKSVRVAVPSPPEQLRIVSELTPVLSRLTELLAQSQSAICLFEERRSALISAAVTGKIDVRDYNPKEAA